jgi:DNA segregation ATPase FtsK/SpoIIIE, S-DNA-T family
MVTGVPGRASTRSVGEPTSARYARVVVIRTDPLADPKPIPWPLVGARSCSLWRSVPVGVDEDGTDVLVTLPERNLLLGGEPGAGKSTILQLLVAVGALDPAARLTLFDPKLVELAVWQGCATRLVGPSVDEAIDVLRERIGELDDRYLHLLANRARKVTAEDGLPLHLLAVEELAFYTNAPTARPRPSSPPCCATTWHGAGRPGYRRWRPRRSRRRMWCRASCGTCSGSAGRCAARPRMPPTRSSAGAGPRRAPRPRLWTRPRGGVGYLLQEGGIPVRLRACYLDDLDLAELARRAEALRGLPAPGRPTLRIVEDSA